MNANQIIKSNLITDTNLDIMCLVSHIDCVKRVCEELKPTMYEPPMEFQDTEEDKRKADLLVRYQNYKRCQALIGKCNGEMFWGIFPQEVEDKIMFYYQQDYRNQICNVLNRIFWSNRKRYNNEYGNCKKMVGTCAMEEHENAVERLRKTVPDEFKIRTAHIPTVWSKSSSYHYDYTQRWSRKNDIECDKTIEDFGYQYCKDYKDRMGQDHLWSDRDRLERARDYIHNGNQVGNCESYTTQGHRGDRDYALRQNKASCGMFHCLADPVRYSNRYFRDNMPEECWTESKCISRQLSGAKWHDKYGDLPPADISIPHHNWTAVQLKNYCRENGLKVGGKKADLWDRVHQHYYKTN